MPVYPSLRNALFNQHQSIFEILNSVGEDKLRIAAELGKWSIQDNLAHLGRYQVVFLERIDKILKTENPSFERYSADTDPEFPTWRSLSLREIREQLEKDRSTIISSVEGLNDLQLQRKGRHPKYGNLNVVEWLEFFILHEAHHIFTIFQLRHT